MYAFGSGRDTLGQTGVVIRGMGVVLLMVSIGLVLSGQSAPVKSQGRSADKVSCSVNRTAPSQGELALAREDYAGALEFFRGTAATEPVPSRAGVIRSLLGEDKIGEASDLAQQWVKEQPASAVALQTDAEVTFRQGEIPEAYALTQKARGLDPCLGREYLLMAKAEELSANFAMGRKHIELAHQLAPTDVEIRKAWTFGLPRKQRLEEEGALLQENLFNPRDAVRLAEGMARAGETPKGSCKMTTPLERATIPMRQIVNDSRTATVGMDVLLNGKRRRLEIDTGASGLLLTRSAVASLGLVRDEKVGVNGIGDKGESAGSIAHVESVRIGELEFHDCAIRIVEKGGSLDVDGLIGGNVFRNFLLTLDFPKRQIELGPLPKRPDEAKEESAGLNTASASSGEGEVAEETQAPKLYDRYTAPEMKDWTRVYRAGHLLFVPMSIGESRSRLFVVDTGASTMLISPEAARAVTKVGSNDENHIRGLSGEVNKVYETGSFTLTFAHLRQRVDRMISIDTTRISHNMDLQVSGFLGAPILQRLTLSIDYRDNLVDFKYATGN